MHSSVGASWWGTRRFLNLSYATSLGGWPGWPDAPEQAGRALTEPERSPSVVTVWPNEKANEKESPPKCLQELHLTTRWISIQDAVLVVFTGDEFSMV